ncbi:MAG TPA: hypothetical protein VFA44_09840 [Gaiellaceae bacterium]|nr:hypothetical protein [Gaiellaceae bacterium]
MIDTEPRVRARGERRRRRRPWRLLLGLALAAGAFALGVALGEALHDNPTPGGRRTEERQLGPLPLGPARETVTVTVTVGGGR